MKTNQIFTLAMAPLALASFIASQEGERKTTPPSTSAAAANDYAYLDDMLGAKVAIAAGAEARREAAQDNKVAKPETGNLDDLIVDQQSGRIESAIVSFGGFLGMGDKTVALPIHLLTWNTEGKRFVAGVDIDQLKALPAYDIKEARKTGFDRDMLRQQTAWTNAKLRTDGARTVEATGERQRDTTDDGAISAAKSPRVPVSPIRYVAASELDDPAVFAVNGTDQFGKVSKVIVDRGDRRVAFYVVSHGGALGVGDSEFLVARDALTPCQKGDDRFYCIDRSVEDMKANGVRYEKPKHGVVDEALIERAQRKTDGR